MNCFAVLIGLLATVAYASAQAGCYWTGCNYHNWAAVGCGPLGMTEKDKQDCDGKSGYIYLCCPAASGGEDGGSGGDGGSGDGSGGDTGTGDDLTEITYEQFSQAVTSNGYPEPGKEKYEIFIASAGPKGSILTKVEAAMALSQFLHESDGLRAKREYACAVSSCPGSYATPGCDAIGQNYYGRGYIQLSWCYNYRPASMDLYNDDRLVHDPDMVAREEQIAWDTAFWYWKTSVHSVAGVSEGKFGVTTRAINGALECWGGHQDQARARFEIYKKIRSAFGIDGTAIENGCYN